MLSKLKMLFALAILAVILAIPASAQEESVSIYVNGEILYQEQMFLIDHTTYAPFNEIFYFITGEEPQEFSVSEDYQYITVNGRYLYNNSPCLDMNGTLFVPIRSIAQLFDAELTWNEETSTVCLNTEETQVVSGDDFYNQNDVYWLSRIINAEALGESFEGKLAVGSVILNRVANPSFPANIKDVIFDTAGGVQFSPTANGAIYNTPGEDSIIAAKICLDGYKVSDSIIYFLNQRIATSQWIVRNCIYIMTVGNHDFYA